MIDALTAAADNRNESDPPGYSSQLYVLENEPGAGWQQLLRTHRPPFGWPSESPGRVGLPDASRALQARCQDFSKQTSRALASLSTVGQSHFDLATVKPGKRRFPAMA